jgi:hypothetical protein
MDDATYAERRMVMKWIYHARDLLRPHGYAMPRVQLRICEEHPRTLGVARLGANAIWISASALKRGDASVGQTVMHELAHTLFSAPHVNGCPLMDPQAPCCPDLPACERVLVRLMNEAAGAEQEDLFFANPIHR